MFNHQPSLRVEPKNKAMVARLKKEKPFLTRRESISREQAYKFIRASVWWDLHPSGPVRASGQANNIYNSNNGWSLDFGANTFLVGVALERCIDNINEFLGEFSKGKLPAINKLKVQLELSISGSVAKNNGYEYQGYYPITFGNLVFGSQSIHLDDCINYILLIGELLIGELSHKVYKLRL